VNLHQHPVSSSLILHQALRIDSLAMSGSLFRAFKHRVNLPWHSLLAGRVGRRHTPDGIANVVGHQQCPPLVDRDANRSPSRISVRSEKASQEIFGRGDGLPVRKWHEHDLVAAIRLAIPRSMLTDECAAPIVFGK
jgi:hypothetical protein